MQGPKAVATANPPASAQALTACSGASCKSRPVVQRLPHGEADTPVRSRRSKRKQQPHPFPQHPPAWPRPSCVVTAPLLWRQQFLLLIGQKRKGKATVWICPPSVHLLSLCLRGDRSKHCLPPACDSHHPFAALGGWRQPLKVDQPIRGGQGRKHLRLPSWEQRRQRAMSQVCNIENLTSLPMNSRAQKYPLLRWPAPVSSTELQKGRGQEMSLSGDGILQRAPGALLPWGTRKATGPVSGLFNDIRFHLQCLPGQLKPAQNSAWVGPS
ncbi:uncharacterized protein LOC123625091 [Lemur catta]|uniref:uncharacterized protein LOC123625091 n=1 Tax=Lemur catta TaxID=9447 RepID=UPI001E26A32B|nr:uncharacterized protein LOC123625091 [Lemur catta]